MGMFDTLFCKYPLPPVEGISEKTEFQTKDFECLIETYIITPQGTLLRIMHDYEIVPEEERPYYNTEQWNQSLGKMIGSLRRVEEKVIQVCSPNLQFNFYTSINRKWVEYQAKLVDNIIQSIVLVEGS